MWCFVPVLQFLTSGTGEVLIFDMFLNFFDSNGLELAGFFSNGSSNNEFIVHFPYLKSGFSHVRISECILTFGKGLSSGPTKGFHCMPSNLGF